MPVELWSPEQWEAFVAAHGPAFFGRREWVDRVCAAIGAAPVYLASSTKGSPTCCVVLARKKRFGAILLLTPALAPYSAWVEAFPADLAPERKEARRLEAIDGMAEWCEANAGFCRIVLPPRVNDIRPFLWRGWRTEVRYTYRLALSEGAPHQFRQNIRRNLDEAREAGLRAECLTGEGAQRALLETVGATFRRQREALPFSEPHWTEYLRMLAESDAVTVVGVQSDERTVATVAVGFDRPLGETTGGLAYELIAGTTQDGAASGASALALSAAFEASAARATEFDFAGANMETIAHYKRGFGGTLTPYLAVEWNGSRTASFLAKQAPGLKSRLRHLFQRGA